MAKQRLDIGSVEGCEAYGLGRQVISSVGATRTLKASESGALCLFDSASGNVFTLPTPVAGMYFDFMQTVTVTSNAAKVITATTASEFLVGSLFIDSIATASGAGVSANGTNIVAISSNGSTTGGVLGSKYRLTAISTTQWAVDGVIVGSGTLATPFATS